MRRLVLCLSGACFALSTAPLACGTDNGQSKSFGTNYDVDGGAPAGDDGSAGDGGAPLSLDASAADATDASGSDNDGDTSDTDAGDAGASCTGLVAVVSGGASSAFGSVYANGAWTTSTLATTVSGTAVGSPAGQSVPAITSLGASFLAVVRTSSNQLASVTWSAGAWGSPANIGAAAARDTPSLTTLGGNGHLVFQGADYKFVHGTYTPGTGFDAANDPVGGAGALQTFGPSAPAVTAASNELVAAFAGDSTTDGGTGGLYDVRYSGGAWMTATSHASTQAYFQATPAIAALPSGNALDLVVVFVDKTTRMLQWTARVAAGKTYTTPALVDATALSNLALSAAALPSGKVALVFMGQDEKPYFSLGTQTGQSFAFTTPAALVSGTNPTLTSPPTVSAGVCGDDAVATYAQGGGAYVTRLRGTTWTAPESLPQVTGALAAGVASH